MSRITDYILEPKVVYTEGGFLVRVKVIDDYKYKKYIVSENLHYKTVQGTSFTITDADTTKQAEITEMLGYTIQEGTPTPSSPVEVKTVSGDNNIVVSNKNLFVATDVFNGYITGNGALVSNAQNRTVILRAKPNTTYTIQAERKGIVRSDDFILSTDSNYPSVGSTTAVRVFTTTDTEIARTFTTRATDNWIAFKVANISNSSFEETLATIQLEEGNQATDYTEHKGSSYRVDLGGKNIFNIEQAITRMENNGGSLINGWGTYEDGILTMNRSMEYHGVCFFAGQKFNLKANKTYTLSATVYLTGTNATSNVILGFEGASNPNVTITKETWTKVSKTVSFTEDKENVRVFIQPSNTGNVLQIKEIMLCEGIDTTYSPYTANPIELTENDKLWNNNGTWQLNDTAITDNYLLEQLQALENIELYEDLCYVDWIGIEKPTMTLQYAGTEDLGIKYIITEDGKKIRTDWRKLGRRKKWKMK